MARIVAYDLMDIIPFNLKNDFLAATTTKKSTLILEIVERGSKDTRILKYH